MDTQALIDKDKEKAPQFVSTPLQIEEAVDMIRTRLRRIKKMHAARRLLRLQTHREIHKIYCRDGTENAAIDRANSEDAVAYKPAIGISFTCLDHDNRRSKILKQSSTNNRKKWPIDKIDDKTENLCLDIIPFTISISVMYPKEEDKEETVPEYDPTEALNTVFVLDLPHKYQFGQLHPTSMFKLPQSLVDLLIDDSVTKLAFHAADIVPQFFYSMTATDTRFLDKTPEKCGYVDISKHVTALGVNGKPFMAYNASRYVGQLMSVDSFPRRSFIEDHYCFLPYSSYAPLYALRYIECTLNAMRVAFVTSFGCGYISGIRVLDRLYSGQGLARESLIQYSVPTSSAISWSFVDMPKQKCEGLDWGLPRLADLMVPRVSVQELPEQLAKGRFQVKKVNVALPIWSVSKGLNVEGSRPERAVGPLSDRIKQRWLEDLEDEKDEYSPSCKKKHKRKMKERKREDKELCADTLPVDVELISSPHQIDAAMDRLIRECSMDKCRFPASMDGVVDVHGLEFDIGHPVVGFDTETTALGLNRHILVKKEKEIAVLLKRKKVLGSLMREEKKKENQRLSNKQIEKWKDPKVASLKTAVVQISTYKTVHIFHISKLGHFPQQLADFILDSRIIKVCQGIRDDLESLVHDFPDVFSEAYERLSSRPKLPSHPKKPMGHQGYSFGLLDLQRLSNAADIFPFGLQAMSAGLLGFYMDKTYQTANWDSEVLHPDLIDYAATDAWASREAYFAMYRMSNRANETLDFLQRKHVVRRAELQRRTFLPDGTPVDSRWHPYPNSASAFAFNFERFTSTFKDPPRYLKENNGPMKTILILAATIAQRYRESNVL